MRRGVLATVAIAAGVLILSVLFQNMGDQTGVMRYQQHREQPSEAALGPCQVCGGEAELCTHLPIIKIETGGQTIPGREGWRPEAYQSGYDGQGNNGEKEIIVQFSTVENESSWKHLDDTPTSSGEALLRFRGNSSRRFEKGSYSFKLIAESDPEQRVDMELLGMNSGSEWALHGPCLDRTLLRNYLCYTTAGQIMDYAPNCRFCELYIHGEYQGVYLLTETIAKGEGRVELTETEPDRPMTSWLLRLDRSYKSTVPLESFNYYTFKSEDAKADLLYPGKNTITPEKIKYVTSDLSAIERTLSSWDLSDHSAGYTNYLDKKAFAQYYIINEFFGNVDAGLYSTYYYKDLRGKIKPVVWDFNNASDNYINYTYNKGGFYVNRVSPFSSLLKDEDFVEEVIRQYRTLRDSYLKDEVILGLVDGTVDYLGSAIDRNNTRWSSLYDLSQFDDANYLFPKSRNYQTYQEAVTQLKTWLMDRGKWMDEHIDSLRQYCHPSRFADQMLG